MRAEVAVRENVIVPGARLVHVLRGQHRRQNEVGTGDEQRCHTGQGPNHALHY
jgi:hypothetical protein